jgi:peptidoglycan hydrolase-like protein with peptidoglycan-binding domain
MIRKFIATVALTGTVIVGAGSGAFAATTNPPKDPAAAAATKEAKCAKAPEVIARIKANQEKRDAAITKLQDAEAKATAAGKTDKVAKIEARLAKVKANADKAAARLAKIEAKVAEKCPKPAA